MKLWVGLLLIAALPAAAANRTRDGSFEQLQRGLPDAAVLAKLEQKGWTFARDPLWLTHWRPNPVTGNTHLEVRADGGHAGKHYLRLAGAGGGHVSSYHGALEVGAYAYRLWVRGKGRVSAGLYKYADRGFYGTEMVIEANVDSDVWVCLRSLYPNTDLSLNSANLVLSATGRVDLDAVLFTPATAAERAYLPAWAVLAGQDRLVTDTDVVDPGELGADLAARLRAAHRDATPERLPNLTAQDWAAVAQRLEELTSIVSGRNPILADEYNQALAMLTALEATSGGSLPGSERKPLRATVTADHAAGVRTARPDRVTIIEVRPDKVLYGLGEKATANAVIVNLTDQAQAGEIVFTEHRDLTQARELKRTPVTLQPRVRKALKVTWTVGREPYGRELRVDFVQDGRVTDSWAEHVAVADEWFWVANTVYRLMKPPHDTSFFSLYGNHGMYFARMPCDFSYQAPCEPTWYSGQARYKIDRSRMIAQIRHEHRFGRKATGYMNMFLGGQAGMETMRRHPEWYVRDANAQPALHRFYGGMISPMGVARPIGEDPGAWCIANVDCHTTEPAKHAAREAIRSAAMFGLDGVMWDGPMTVIPGYSWDGEPTDHGGDYEQQSIKAMLTFVDAVESELPHYKTWVNWGEIGTYRPENIDYYGSDRQAFYTTVVPRLKCVLLEMRGQLHAVGPTTRWRYNYDQYLAQRDSVTQTLGVPCMNGWIWRALPEDEPGPSRWAWVATNHMASLLTATQFHVATFGMPSWRPFMQFWTRHSALIWARDLRLVRDAATRVSVTSARPLWWERTVYERQAAAGKDILVNLVNEPVTEGIVFLRPDDPPAVTRARVRVTAPDEMRCTSAWALRPYDWGEPQQPQCWELPVSGSGEVTVPDFRYYMLIVFRFERQKGVR